MSHAFTDVCIHMSVCLFAAACQTLLSLPVDFNLEAILGKYCDPVFNNTNQSSWVFWLFVNGSAAVPFFKQETVLHFSVS